MNRPSARLLCLGLACLLPAGAGAADSPDLNSLLDNSPFGSAVSGVAQVKAENPVEFRGVFAQGGEYFFNVYLAAQSRAEWLGLDETFGESLKVKHYDAINQQLTIELDGKSLTLALASAKRPAATAPAATNRALPAAKGPDTSAEPAPSVSDQERLNKIADEIRRRRALRQQALQKNQ